MPAPDPVATRLAAENVTVLYHFTSVENLPNIARHQALCCKTYLSDRGEWPCAEPGGNELSLALDRRQGNWDYVELSFTPYNPMAYHRKRERHLCWFLIDPHVASLPGVQFTDTNATSSGHKRAAGVVGLDLVNFKAARGPVQPWDRDGWVKPVQAEVLVPERVPLAAVRQVAFVSTASQEEGLRLWGDWPHPPFVVRPMLFADSLGGTPTFPYLVHTLLTDERVTRENIAAARAPMTDFTQRNRDIHLVAEVEALVGTDVRLLWEPVGHGNHLTLERTSRYSIWPELPRERVRRGHHRVTIRIDNIRWATLRFEVRP